MAEGRNQRVPLVRQMDRLEERQGLRHVDVARARPDQREPSPGDAAASKEDAVAYAEAAEELRNLIGPSQTAADALMRRQIAHVLAEEANTSGGERKFAG